MINNFKNRIFILFTCLIVCFDQSNGQLPISVDQNQIKINLQEALHPNIASSYQNIRGASIFSGGWSSRKIIINEPGKEEMVYGYALNNSQNNEDILYPRSSFIPNFGQIQLTYSSIGGSIVSRPVSYYFGDKISPPLKNLYGEQLSEGSIDTYWRKKPHEIKTVTNGNVSEGGSDWNVGDIFVLDHRDTVSHIVISNNNDDIQAKETSQNINIEASTVVLRIDDILKFSNGALLKITKRLSKGDTVVNGILSLGNLQDHDVGYFGDVNKTAKFKVVQVENSVVEKIELMDGGQYIGNFAGKLNTRIISDYTQNGRNIEPANLTVRAQFDFENFYWSEHAESVFATESGVIPITWISKEPIEDDDIQEYKNKGMRIYSPASGNNFVLLDEYYIISGASKKPSKKIFWNGNNIYKAPRVEIPSSGINEVKIIYNKTVPETFISNIPVQGESANFNQNKTVWIEYGYLHALNVEGKVFIEYLGERKPNGRSNFHLGYDVVEISQYAPVKFVNTVLGEELMPDNNNKYDENLIYTQDSNLNRILDVGISQSRKTKKQTMFAERILPINEFYVAYWSRKDKFGIMWPEWKTKYKFHWPDSPEDYILYPRESVSNDLEAKLSKVKLTTELSPAIAYQTNESQNRAKITSDTYFYTYLDNTIDENRALIRYRLHDGSVKYERVYSYLNSWASTVKNFNEGVINENNGTAVITPVDKSHNYKVNEFIYIGGAVSDNADVYNGKHKIVTIANNGDISIDIPIGSGSITNNVEVTNSTKDSWYFNNAEYSDDILPVNLSRNATIGQRILPPSVNDYGLPDLTEHYVGYINKKQGSLYNINAYIDPLIQGYSNAKKGSIIPVNKIPGISEQLQVWWFRENRITENAINLWPSVIVDYNLLWPHETDGYKSVNAKNTIVLASNDGSGPLDSLKANGEIYFVNERGKEIITVNAPNGYNIASTTIDINIDELSYPISSGTIIYFSNGGKFVVTSDANANDTKLTGKLTSEKLINDEKGFAISEGYNPNEEHALMEGGQVYALRDDLNILNGNKFSSEPYVLLEYTDTDNRPSMMAYRVLREQIEANLTFNFDITAGNIIQAPMPLPLLDVPTDNSGKNLNKQLGNLLIDNAEVTDYGKISATFTSNDTQVHFYDTKSLLKIDVKNNAAHIDPMLYVTRESFIVNKIEPTSDQTKALITLVNKAGKNLGNGDRVRIFGSKEDYYNSTFQVVDYNLNQKQFYIILPNNNDVTYAVSDNPNIYVEKVIDYKTKITGYLTAHDVSFLSFVANKNNNTKTYKTNIEAVNYLAGTKPYVVIIENSDGVRWYPEVTGTDQNKSELDLDFSKAQTAPKNSESDFRLIIPLNNTEINTAQKNKWFQKAEIFTESVIAANSNAKKVTYTDRKNNIWVYRGGHNDGDKPGFAMQFYYNTKANNFWFPEYFKDSNVNAEQNIQPYLRPKVGLNSYSKSNGVKYDALPIVYNAQWPSNAPVMRTAQTLTKPVYGLPSISGQSSIKVLYQESLHYNNINSKKYPVSALSIDDKGIATLNVKQAPQFYIGSYITLEGVTGKNESEFNNTHLITNSEAISNSISNSNDWTYYFNTGITNAKGSIGGTILVSQSKLNPLQSVVLHDPTKEKLYYINKSDNELNKPFKIDKESEATILPTSMNKEVRRGMTYFPDLPPHLVDRLFFDPNRGQLGAIVLKGENVKSIVGSDYILSNALTDSDKADIKNIVSNSSEKSLWKSIFEGGSNSSIGYANVMDGNKLSFDRGIGLSKDDRIIVIGAAENGNSLSTTVKSVSLDGTTVTTAEPASSTLYNCLVFRNVDLEREKGSIAAKHYSSSEHLMGNLEYYGNKKQKPVDISEGVSYYNSESAMEVIDDDIAVNSYALTAIGPGFGYITLIAGDGENFTSEEEPTSLYIIKVEPILQDNEVKIIAADNPLNEKITMQQILDFAGRSDLFDFEWKIASPVDGQAPIVYKYTNKEIYTGGSWKYIKYPKKSHIDTLFNSNNLSSFQNAYDISNTFASINTVAFKDVQEDSINNSQLIFTNVEDIDYLSLGNSLTLTTYDGEEMDGKIAKIDLNGGNKNIHLDLVSGIDLKPSSVNKLQESIVDNVPQSILFNEFNINDNTLGNAKEYWICMDLESGTDVEVYINNQLLISKFNARSTKVENVDILSGGQGYKKDDRIRLSGGMPYSQELSAEFVVKSVINGAVTELYSLSDGSEYFKPGKYQVAPLSQAQGLDVSNLSGASGSGLKLNVKFQNTINTPTANLPPSIDNNFNLSWKIPVSAIKSKNNLIVKVFSENDPDTFQNLDVKIYTMLFEDKADPGINPQSKWKPISATGEGKNPTTNAVIGRKADIRALIDNYVIMRYRANNDSYYSDESKKWSKWTEPQLAEGWIKRVLAGINPFNQRSDDLSNNSVNTGVSMLTQAGKRWEGDVALNLDNINDSGLIEVYETVLNRGKNLSIGSSPGINFGPANDALLLAAGYLNDLYNFLGDEAVADAANPTIGIGTGDGELGSISSSMFAFKGQVGTLLEEELALIRGRDDMLMPGVRTSPAYNRLYWNYTRGIDSGEVIYALNYNINEDQDGDFDGVINAEDAQKMYPQGHGDSYGHYLSALKGYYKLIADNDFTWVPRIEAVLILGKPVAVDYFDERKFAKTAARLSSAGNKAAELTWRKDYYPDKNQGWGHLGAEVSKFNEKTGVIRNWGFDHWASRTGAGSYLNWVVGNSMLPDKDPNPDHEGIQIIDRGTVPELLEIALHGDELQIMMDNAENGLNPLGMNEDSIAFDIDPHFLEAGSGTFTLTHFDQIYTKAVGALSIAHAAFDDAKGVTELMRSEENTLNDLEKDIAGEELSFKHELIELYGTPYPDDIGPARTYPQGYDGPDLVHYAYIENDITSDLAKQLLEVANFTDVDEKTDEVSIDIQNWDDDWTYDQIFNKYNYKAFTSNKNPSEPNINHYIDQFKLTGSQNKEKVFGGDIPRLSYQMKKEDGGKFPEDEYEQVVTNSEGTMTGDYISYNFNKTMGEIVKPASWKSKRKSPGEIQSAKSSVVNAHYALRQALAAHSQAKILFDKKIELFTAKLLTHDAVLEEAFWLASVNTVNDAIQQAYNIYDSWEDLVSKNIDLSAQAVKTGIPDNLLFGLAAGGQTLSSIEALVDLQHYGVTIVPKYGKNVFYTVTQISDLATREANRWRPLSGSGPLEWRDEVRGVLHELDTSQKELEMTLFDIVEKLQEKTAAEQAYDALLAKGDRLQAQRHIFRKRASSKIQRYRTRDASFRIFRNEKLERYKRLFDMSAKYTYLAAKAYDYETGLLKENDGKKFINRIIASRALGVVSDGEPQYAGSNAGDPGLSSILAEMKADYEVLRGRLGYNNPDTQGTTMSLRFEKYRILPGNEGQQEWKNILYSSLKENILDDKDVSTYCLQVKNENGNPVPGIIIEFSTSIHDGYNVFGNPLAGGDNSFSPSNFATKIHGVGIGFEDYVGIGWVLANPDSIPADAPWLDPNSLSNTPYVYLIPVGSDIMRAPPLGDKSDLRSWSVNDITIPLPFNIGGSNFSIETAWQKNNFLDDKLFNIRKHQAFRAVLWEIDKDGAGTFDDSAPIYAPSKMMNNRLVGRSVWNTKWKLIIPGKTLLNDPNEGLERFINNVSDIKIHFETYSFSGN